MIGKGKISALYQDGKIATVKPYLGEVVTPELVVPFFLYKCLEIEMPVVYASFEDGTGIILARMDGEWNHKIEGDLEMTKTIRGAEVLEGNVRLGTHTHTDSLGGGTSTPK